ncbi:MAG TPA: hypothetical protein VJN02_00535 [Gammaproteobacteria bacterium]|nr:hypothetical protein [Gammaproteobacteria bacterium]
MLKLLLTSKRITLMTLVSQIIIFLLNYLLPGDAYSLTPQENKLLATSLSTNVAVVTKGSDFYQRGLDCYHNLLTSITYFPVSSAIFLWANDENGQCYLYGIYLGPLSIPTQPGTLCMITKKQYHSLFLKKYYDAIKKMDTTNTPHPTFFEFIKKIHSCLQQNPLSIEKISEALKLSKQMQIQPPSNHDALTHQPI